MTYVWIERDRRPYIRVNATDTCFELVTFRCPQAQGAHTSHRISTADKVPASELLRLVRDPNLRCVQCHERLLIDHARKMPYTSQFIIMESPW